MNMRERIARTIREANKVIADKHDLGWQHYLSDADAVILAIREPTGAMIKAGQRHSMNGSPRDIYTAMIDAVRHD